MLDYVEVELDSLRSGLEMPIILKPDVHVGPRSALGIKTGIKTLAHKQHYRTLGAADLGSTYLELATAISSLRGDNAHAVNALS